jgi:Leucine-rich repeat (LRR) protein
VVQTDIITRDLLSPGINLQKKYSINVPDSFGKYTIAAKIDTKNEATEENESNNECDQPCRFYVVSPDRDELCALFKTTQGSDWTNKNNWDTFQSISQWYGVSTDDNRRVIGISLSDNGLDGTIPTEIGELEYLQEIVLANNDLTGEIPLELLSLSNLVRLDLSENSFSNGIPSEIGQLESLEYLDLTNSVNSSQVPSSIQFLGELIHLNLSDNSISGSFPDEICQLSNLEYLNMNSHNLTGELPDCFSSLSKLEYFYAVPMFTPFLGKGYSEGLSGMIPSNIGNLVNVKEISLQHNSFQGSLPQQIGELKSITKLDLSYNDISGVLPSSIGKLKNIKELYLQHNGIEGEIPESISNLTKLELLNIAANKLSGKIPALLGGLNELRVVNLFDNMLEGSVPKQIGMLELLEEIDLRDNELNGTLPVEIGNLENLKHIYLQDNKISGSIPESIGQLQALEELFLQNNELSNHIPTSIGNLKSLISLNVNNNNLNGKIPLEIGELINMEDIDMSNNELSGELPTELFGLKKLVYLRLGHNTLSGQIPLNINGLDEVYEIDLQDNELIGQIPPEISELSQLTHLYLSNNVLSGEVPSDIYSLNLCDFDIRNNYIEKLPKKLAESRSFMFCTGDKYYGFDVSNNYLQFDSFESNLDCFINQDCGSHYVGSYSPQRSIQVDPNEYVLKNGQIIEIAIGVGGEHNQYQWFKDDESITSVSADPAYTKKASISDSGTYICHITNTVVPDLTLYTEDITVTVQSIDQDNDGLTDQIENGSCTNATDADTDDDGILDGDEDANHNGIVDPGETDPCNPDTDGDGIQDGTEIGLTNDDLGEDTDADIFVPAPDPGITTDPNNADTDNDGYSDGEEKSNASDPNNPNTIPCPGNSGPMNVNTSNGDISAKGQTCSNSACGEEPGLDFLYGLLKFKITDLDTTQAETVEVTITYPDPIPEGSKFYKCDPESGQWLDVTQYMSFTPGDTTAVMTVTDNQFPDVNDDLGVIEDPFGPAQAGNSEESGEPLAVPTVSQWGMIVMALLLALAGVWIVGRRHGRI